MIPKWSSFLKCSSARGRCRRAKPSSQGHTMAVKTFYRIGALGQIARHTFDNLRCCNPLRIAATIAKANKDTQKTCRYSLDKMLESSHDHSLQRKTGTIANPAI